MMAPKRKNSDAGSSNIPKRSRKVLPLSEKVKVLDLIRKEKKSYAEVAKIYGKNESSIREIVKKEKEIRASFAVAPLTAKVTATVRDKCLVNMEKALSLWVEDMNRKCVPLDGNMLRQKALNLYEDFSKGSRETSDTKTFTASKGWLHRFRNRFGLRTIKSTGEAVPAAEEAAATFPAELKKLIKEKGYQPKQVLDCDETGLFCTVQTMAHSERTFIAIKPDGVQRSLVGEIIKRFEQKGFRLVAMKFMRASEDLLKEHYNDLKDRPFFAGLVKYMHSGPVVAMVWEGLNVVKTGRVMLGETNPADSKPGTIRGDFCIQVGRNIIHGSDSVESAEKEIALWFQPEELVDYKSCAQSWIYE
ncbi:nucleoside diphosphate kinase A isoform X1 [Equus przewalskii]|uniref:Nucleoside diphosphate kinase n=2 Tax=Equus TaxID=9789 RepID=A0A9L0R3C6_HORSE